MKIVWKRRPEKPLSLYAYADEILRVDIVGFITEDDMVEVSNWCHKNNCGKRMSFDTFQFKNESQITMFLLRWS